MSDLPSHKIYAPATVANVGSGYDVFSFAISEPGDIIEIIPRDDHELKVSNKTSNFPSMPLEPAGNVTSHSMKLMMKDSGIERGFDIYYFTKR